MAMKNTYTEYVLPIDIDILPSMNVNSKFSEFIQTRIEQNRAFILPVFETNVSMNAAVTRDTLIEMWNRGTVRPFHHNFCRHCHAHTDYQRWKSLKVGKNLSVGYYRDWRQYWEPYLITKRDEVPAYNETFRGYGFDRMSQMCELYMSGFKFAVLDDGFLVHDGFKERRSTYKDRAREIEVYRVFYNDFKRILLKRYPNTGRKLALTR